MTFEPDHVDMPDGVNIFGCFRSSQEKAAIAQIFQLDRWNPELTDAGYTLNKVLRFGPSRKSAAYKIEYTLILRNATSIQPYVISGQVERPSQMAQEIRQLLWRHDGRSNNLDCLWREESSGEIWRDIPATVELLELDIGHLSNEDLAAINASYIRLPLTDLKSCSRLSGLYFLVESVVVDKENITYYCRLGGINRLNWCKVRAISVVGPDSGFSNVLELRISEGLRTLFIKQGCEGFSLLLDRLAKLPRFPIENLNKILKKRMWDGEIELWKRDATDSNPTDESPSITDDVV